MKGISVIGGINLDIKARAGEEFIIGNSNPARVQYVPGGVARNIAENLARLEVPVRLFGYVGDDPFGEMLLRETASTGADISGVEKRKDKLTGVDVNLMRDSGEMWVALSDMNIIESLDSQFVDKYVDKLFDAEMVIADANLPVDTLQYMIDECNKRNIRLAIEPSSIQKTRRLNPLSGDVFLLTPGEAELSVLDTRLRITNMVITQGENGVLWQNELIPAVKTEVVDTLGAGDALMAGILAALYRGYDFRKALRFGNAAAGITIQSEDTVSKEMKWEELLRISAYI